jgi:hypothetical protein
MNDYILSQIAGKLEAQGKKLNKHVTHESGGSTTGGVWVDCSATMEWHTSGNQPDISTTAGHVCGYTTIGRICFASYDLVMAAGTDYGTEDWAFYIPKQFGVWGVPTFQFANITCIDFSESKSYSYFSKCGLVPGFAQVRAYTAYEQGSGYLAFGPVLDATNPFIWTTNDTLHIDAIYPID